MNTPVPPMVKMSRLAISAAPTMKTKSLDSAHHVDENQATDSAHPDDEDQAADSGRADGEDSGSIIPMPSGISRSAPNG
jgi:hypothetical protein